MRIKIEGKYVCSICGSPWESASRYDGTCASCGADPMMEDFPLTEWNWGSARENDQDEREEDSRP